MSAATSTFQTRRGAALFLVLAIVAALSAVAVTGLRTLSVDVAGAKYSANRTKALAIARSGFLMAASLLLLDYKENAADHGYEDWARYFKDPELREDLFSQGKLGTQRLLELFDEEHLHGSIMDESGKFPIAALASKGGETYRKVFVALLRNAPFNLDEAKAQSVLLAIVDWLDEDDEAGTLEETGLGASGAEDAWYQEDKAAYRCKNSSLDSLQELLLVRGVSRELFEGSGGIGLKDLLSIWNTAKININTAPAPILMALDYADPDREAAAFATAVVDFRDNEQNSAALEQENWYADALPQTKSLTLPTEIITVKSSVFTIRMDASEGGGRASLFAAVKRNYDESLSSSLDFKGIIQTLYRSVR